MHFLTLQVHFPIPRACWHYCLPELCFRLPGRAGFKCIKDGHSGGGGHTNPHKWPLGISASKSSNCALLHCREPNGFRFHFLLGRKQKQAVSSGQQRPHHPLTHDPAPSQGQKDNGPSPPVQMKVRPAAGPGATASSTARPRRLARCPHHSPKLGT